MDASKRHQLKTNELAEALSRIRDWGSDPQTRYWTIGLAVVVVLAIGYRVWSQVRESRVTNAWSELDTASAKVHSEPTASAAALRALISSTSDPVVAANARLRLAGLLLSEVDKQPDNADELLTQVVEALKPLTEDAQVAAPLAATAEYALGTAYEDLRKLDLAGSAYKRLTEDQRFAGSPFVERAAKRLQNLEDLRRPVTLQAGAPPVPQIPNLPAGINVAPSPSGAPQPKITPLPGGPPGATPPMRVPIPTPTGPPSVPVPTPSATPPAKPPGDAGTPPPAPAPASQPGP